MVELKHTYSHKIDWYTALAKSINATLINDKIAIFPENIGQGVSFSCTVMDGMSVVLIDGVFTADVLAKRIESDDDLYILHFDLSEKINMLNIDENRMDGCVPECKSGFSVVHSSIGSNLILLKGQRVFTLRILIEREKLINYLIEKDKKLKNIEKKILFYNHLNSNNKLLINSLKGRSVFDADFELYIKGISFKVLANFIDTYTQPTKSDIRKVELNGLNTAAEFLITNVKDTFPGLSYLAKIAIMSKTKFKASFKKVYDEGAYSFFVRCKMTEANKLIKTGNFTSLIEISNEVNYNRKRFITAYFKYFNRHPLDDFKCADDL